MSIPELGAGAGYKNQLSRQDAPSTNETANLFHHWG